MYVVLWPPHPNLVVTMALGSRRLPGILSPRLRTPSPTFPASPTAHRQSPQSSESSGVSSRKSSADNLLLDGEEYPSYLPCFPCCSPSVPSFDFFGSSHVLGMCCLLDLVLYMYIFFFRLVLVIYLFLGYCWLCLVMGSSIGVGSILCNIPVFLLFGVWGGWVFFCSVLFCFFVGHV